ncbi:MAG: site-2 protease family protein [Candidatus Micrarchaeota archaeon]|nr:site-2 protease family protein [Candidatus Micrarchaeota archaeon]
MSENVNQNLTQNNQNEAILNKEPTLPDMLIIFMIAAIIVTLFTYLFKVESIPGIFKIGIVIITLYMISLSIAKMFNSHSSFGIVMVRSKKYNAIIEEIAKKFKYTFMFFADISIVMAFGVFSYFLIKENKKIIIPVGLILTLLVNFFVIPFIFPLTTQLISAREISEYQQQAQTQRPNLTASLILFGLSVLFGYVTSSFILLALQSLLIIDLFIKALNNQISADKITPGAVPVIPGVTIPLIEGIIALAIILVVHESAHGIIARIHEIEIKSTGLVFFGPIPIGAFVDADEQTLFKKDSVTVSRVVASGPVSNLLLSLIVLMILISFNILAFFIVSSIPELKNDLIFKTPYEFIFKTLGLLVLLNFMIGFINMIPVPFFDGSHLVNHTIPNEFVRKVIVYSSLAMFVLAVIPILFRI